MRGLGRGAAAVAACLVAATTARAQALRVAAVDSATGLAVPNALLTAVDARGVVAANVATTLGGPRLLAVPGAGTYTLTVRRIGKRPYTAAPVVVGPRDTIALVLHVPSHPVALAMVRVTARAGECARSNRNGAVTALWDQIRTAITLVTLRHDAPDAVPAELRRYAARLAGNAQTVLAETVLPPQLGLPRPFGTFAPEMLSGAGYIHHAEGTDAYAIPDEDALLSPQFAAEHCFDAVAGENAQAGLVGLAFRPAPSRRVPDIQGVLWADSATTALRYLEFWYVDPALSSAVTGEGRAGGEVHFATLPDSGWAMVAWRLRIPRSVGSVRHEFGRSWFDNRWEFTEVGAVAKTRDTTPASVSGGSDAGAEALARLAARVRGGRAAVRVTDAAGHPLAGASVRLTQQPDSEAAGFVMDSTHTRLRRAPLLRADTVVTTDATGAVEVSALPPGPYHVRIAHPTVARAGVEPPVTDLVVVADSLAPSARVAIAPPTLAALAGRCGAGQLVDTTASRVLYGTVTDGTTVRADTAGTVPAAHARVTVAWTTLEGGRSVRRTTTDARGSFVVCGIPEIGTPTVGAEWGKQPLVAPTRRVSLDTWRAAFIALDLRPSSAPVEPPLVAASTPATLTVTGTVVDSVVDAPLPGATVQMVDAANPLGHVYEARSDSIGTFRISNVPPGRYLVHFEHPTLADYGFELGDHVSDLQPGWREAEMTLAGPSAAQVLARACPQAGDSTGLVLGRLRIAGDSTPLIVGRVRASWDGRAQGVVGAVGTDGVFRLCGVPRGTRVTLAAELSPGRLGAPIAVVTSPHGVSVTDVVLRRSP